MTLRTVAVTCRAADQGGQPVARALYRATLDRTELDAGFVAPETTQATAGDDGVAVLRLWPNSLGTAASSYRVRAWLPDGAKFLDVRAVVPDADCRLDEILLQAPFPPIDAAEQALRTAQGALALVTEQAEVATKQAGAAAASAAAAAESHRLSGLDALATADDRVVAVDAAEVAARKAGEAADSASAAAASKRVSGEKADAAALAAGAAAGSAVIAEENAGLAIEQAGIATDRARAASDSAAAAAESRRLAGLDAEATAADRAIAVGAAESAAGQADEAAYSATLAGAAAQAAAIAVYGQLAAIKQQAEEARDAALAGLGAADNSQTLSGLVGAISYAADLAGQAVREIVRVDAGVKQYDSAVEAIAYALTAALDLAGVTARAVSGGEVALGAGAAAAPSLSAVGDRDTGVFFPAANSVAMATSALERLRITADGRVGIGTTAPSGLLDVNDNKIRVRVAQTPASAAAAGNPGEFAWDANFFYMCVAANTWRRAPHSTW